MTAPSPTAWYLRCGRDDVGDRAVLVGDRGRVAIAATILEDAVVLNEDRGLTTATGTYRGERITVSAFGMGAPIAAIVLHELSTLGVTQFIRLGTALTLGSTRLGDFVVAHGAVRNEGTSAGYLPVEYPAVPDFDLTRRAERAALASGSPTRSGLYATFDGFYTDMFDLDPRSTRAAETLAFHAANGVIAADMETSALFVAARALGVAAASLCLASVDGSTREKLPHEERVAAEARLLRAGFDALVADSDTL
ncbi:MULTISPECIES: nucleoside phosphorylase [unclassified Leifsonia]|mgnify:FL=1|uniref:nucleoside phosphorylase n=1 Tax=unclassified Leifsonia TaxID=2663824 RepID=UPI0009283E2B|nr:hypothetical protein [Leifsonia sp. 71-9]OJX75570.1 MAG: hypothetical protein BGO91_20055 [Leifsonia sp. 71-9]